MHIYDAMRYVVSSPGNKVYHKSWDKNQYVYMSESGVIMHHTNNGNFYYDWLKNIYSRIGWEIYNE